MVSYDRNLASSNMMLNKKPHMSHIPRFSAGLGSPSPRLGDYGNGRRDTAADEAYYEHEQTSYRANGISHKDCLNLNRPGSTLVNRSQSLKNPYDTSSNNNYGRSVDYDSQGRNIAPMTKASNRPEFYRENSGTRSPLNYNRAEANIRSPRPGAEMSPRHHYQHQLADNRSSISGHHAHDEKNRSTAIAAEPMVNDKHRNRREDLDEINKRYYEFYDKSNAGQHHHHHHEHQLQPQPQPQPQPHHHHHDRDYDNHDHGHHHKSNPRKLNKTRMQYIRKKYKNKISANISGTKFDIIRDVLELMGCRILPDDNFDCNLIWDDTRVSIEGISELKAFQHYNHFPAMSEISKKDALARNISKMYKLMPKEFDFVPKTWIMPSEYSNLLSYSLDMRKMHVKKTYIMKPSNGAMGHGIKLFKNVEKIQPTENYIVQEYINNPYLIDGFKFDMRIYALVTSCDPLRAFIYEDGLVRLGTEEYHEPNESNIDHLYMHLTNYSVNKRNKSNYDEGDENGERGSKRSLAFLFEHLRRNNKDADLVWKNIQDIILKTILVAEPYLFHTYKMCRPGQIAGTESVCFEILGFDILLDEKMKPWVLEVNRCPSFGANQDIDKRIKTHLLIDSFELLHLRPTDRLKVQTLEKAEAKKRLYNLTSHSSKSDLNSLNNESSSLLQSKTIQSSSSSNLSSYSTIKKYKPKEKRKLELIEQIKILRREQRRQDYENRNRGNYIRLFPKEDKHDMEYYLNILNAAFNLFYPVGKHLQWKKTYEKIKEDELLNELVEFDDEIYDSTNYEQNRKLNEYLKDDYTSTESEDSVNSDDDDDDASYQHRLDSYYDRSRAHQHDHDHHDHHQQRDYVDGDRINEPKLNKSPSMKNFVEQQTIKSNRLVALVNAVSTPSLSKLSTYSSSSNSNSNNNRITSKLTRDTRAFNDSKTLDVMNANSNQSNMQHLLTKIRLHQAKQNDPDLFAKKHNADNSASQAAKNNDDKLTDLSNSNLAHLNSAFLKLLTQLEIKYPGKDSQETRSILQKIYTKFEMYKPKLANYWMAKLDDAKRNKILGIVKSNVIVLLKKVYMIDELEKLRMYKILVKLLNRMLWMHGLGLWNCFINSNNSSWESIFSKSSFQISESEFKCCYRMVELCKDCLLIVYQYAFEQKSNEKESPGASNTPTSLKSNRPYLPLAASNTNLSTINQKTRIKNN